MSPNSRSKVFISYSHKDADILKRLQTHLTPLVRGGIDVWDDTKIKAGSNWRLEIKNAIDTAKVAICLISADFLASKYIFENELPPLLEAAQKDGLLMLPVIISASRFEETENLNWMQSVNRVSQPLREMTRAQREKIYNEIAKNVEDAFGANKDNDNESFNVNSKDIKDPVIYKQRLDLIESEILLTLDGLRTLLKEELNINSAQNELKEIIARIDESNDKIINNTFTIAVLALTKSGKSTFLNSLLGAEFLPISNVPETANLVHILHTPKITEGILEHHFFARKKRTSVTIEGISKIRDYLKKLNSVRRESQEISRDYLELRAPLYGLGYKKFGKYRFRIIDTAGYNEDGVETLKHDTLDVLEGADVIIYLMDYTKLKTQEEGKFFNEIQDRRNSLVTGFLSRLFFVVNKIDAEDRNGLNKHDVAQYVSSQLKNKISGIQIEPDDIFLVSADHAMLARVFLGNQSTKKQRDDLAAKLFGYGALPPEKFNKEEKVEWTQRSERLLTNSGIPILEEKIFAFLEANSRRLLILATLEHTIISLKKVSNYLQIAEKQLSTKKIDAEQQIQTIESNLRFSLKQFEEIQKQVKSIPTDAKKVTQKKFSDFQKKSAEVVNKILSEYDVSDITKVSTNKDEIVDIVKGINERVWSNLQPEATRLEQDLQELLYNRQKQLITEFSNSAEPVIRQIEQIVGKTFKVSLHAINLEINLPSRKEYILSITKNANDLIKKKRGDFNPKFKGWWLIIPVFKFFDDNYSISPEVYKEKFTKQIEKVTDDWSIAVNKLIENQISPAFKKVADAVLHYGNSYVEIAKNNIKFQQSASANSKDRMLTISIQLNEQEKNIIKFVEFEKELK